MNENIDSALNEVSAEDVEAMCECIGKLLEAIDLYHGPGMHWMGQTPDWYVYAAYIACFGKKPTNYDDIKWPTAHDGEYDSDEPETNTFTDDDPIPTNVVHFDARRPGIDEPG